MNRDQGDVTEVLGQVKQGVPDAHERLMGLVYRELRRIAGAHMRRESSTHSLQPTALVHEAYLRMIDITEVDWEDRAHFYSVASTQMRRILVDHARARDAGKRGGGNETLWLDEELMPAPGRPPELCALDDALTRLAEIASRPAKIVEMRFFAGMTEEEIGKVLGITSRTVKRDWRMAKAWLFHELDASSRTASPPRS